MVGGSVGQFIYSLPVVIACSLVASRLVSMTFIPMLAYYLLRPGKRPERTLEEQRQRGFSGLYYRVGCWALDHRWEVLGASLVFLFAGGLLLTRIKTETSRPRPPPASTVCRSPRCVTASGRFRSWRGCARKSARKWPT